MGKSLELIRQAVNGIRNEVEEGANTAARVGGALSDVLEYAAEEAERSQGVDDDMTKLVEQNVGDIKVIKDSLASEIQRAKDAEGTLSEEIDYIKEAISGGTDDEGSSEVTRTEFELVKAESAGTFKAFSDLGMTEETETDGYKIALNKSSNTAEKTSVKIPVYDTENPAVHPVGLVDEVFVEDMGLMMDDKIDKALENYTPSDSVIEVVQVTGDSEDSVMSQKAVTEKLTNLSDGITANAKVIALMSEKVLAIENNTVYLTMAEYQELVAADKIDENVEYNIYED